LIVGRAGRGRTSALYEVARQLSAATGRSAGLISIRNSQAMRPSFVRLLDPQEIPRLGVIGNDAEWARYVADRGLATLPDGRLMLLVDDYHMVETVPDNNIFDATLLSLHQKSRVQLVIATMASGINKGSLTGLLKSTGTALYLQPSAVPSDTDDGWRVRGTVFRHRPGFSYRRNDAIVQNDNGQSVIHLVDYQGSGLPG
jgi:hypothetical protein